MPTEPRTLVRRKKPAVIRGAFVYPSQAIVLAGKCEDGWSAEKWSTWPGNQFEPEQQQVKYLEQLRRIAGGLDVQLTLEEQPLFTDAGVRVLYDAPRRGTAGSRVNFAHPKDCGGVLVELVEAPAGASH